MTLHLIRCRPEHSGCLGVLRINDGGLECFTLEPGDGAHRARPGEYDVRIASGGKLGALYRHMGHPGVLQLAGVPGHSGIDIHAGNTARDTHGCILVGFTADCMAGPALRNSHPARDALYGFAVPAAKMRALRIVITEG